MSFGSRIGGYYGALARSPVSVFILNILFSLKLTFDVDIAVAPPAPAFDDVALALLLPPSLARRLLNLLLRRPVTAEVLASPMVWMVESKGVQVTIHQARCMSIVSEQCW